MEFRKEAIAYFNGRPLFSSLLIEDPSMTFEVKDLRGNSYNVRQIFDAGALWRFFVISRQKLYKIIGCGGVLFEDPIEIKADNIKTESVKNATITDPSELYGLSLRADGPINLEFEEIPAPILYMIEADEYVREWEAPEGVNKSGFEYCFEEFLLKGPAGPWSDKILACIEAERVYSEIIELAECPEWFAQILFHKVAGYYKFYDLVNITKEQLGRIYDLRAEGLSVKKVAQEMKISRDIVRHFAEFVGPSVTYKISGSDLLKIQEELKKKQADKDKSK